MDASADTFETALGALAETLVSEQDLDSLLHQIAGLACVAIPRCTFAGVTVVEEGAFRTSARSHPEVQSLDDAQYRADDGPCLVACRTAEVVVVEDASHDDRWPHFSATAGEHAVRSSFSAPLTVSGSSLGALNLYSRTTGPYDGKATSFAALCTAQS